MKTLFDKIWDAHVVQQVEDGPTQLYIDRLYAHEVTSPQAFDTLRDKGLKVFRPDQVIAMPGGAQAGGDPEEQLQGVWHPSFRHGLQR